jgi:hypothetical protein
LRPDTNIPANDVCLKCLSYLQFYEYLNRLTQNHYTSRNLELIKQFPGYIAVTCFSLRDRVIFCVVYQHTFEIIQNIVRTVLEI